MMGAGDLRKVGMIVDVGGFANDIEGGNGGYKEPD
jgi:hypothetical protein